MVAILSLSSPTIRCDRIVDAMILLGIQGDVTPNTSVFDGALESGCRAIISGPDAKKDAHSLWNRIKHTENATCGHVWVGDVTSGCVLDVFRPSACPAK